MRELGKDLPKMNSVMYIPKGQHVDNPTKPAPSKKNPLFLMHNMRVCEESLIHSYSKLTVGRSHNACVL